MVVARDIIFEYVLVLDFIKKKVWVWHHKSNERIAYSINAELNSVFFFSQELIYKEFFSQGDLVCVGVVWFIGKLKLLSN